MVATLSLPPEKGRAEWDAYDDECAECWDSRWDSVMRRWRAMSWANREAESSGSVDFFLDDDVGCIGLGLSLVADGGREDFFGSC